MTGIAKTDEHGIYNELAFNEAKRAQRWKESKPPAEEWNDEGDSDEFSISVVGEEVDQAGNSSYEVWWHGWKGRDDGSKTTWETAIYDFSAWETAQQSHRVKLAEKSLQIDVQTKTDIHNTDTFLKSQGYSEKLAMYKSNPTPNRMAELLRLRAKHDEYSSNMDVDNSLDVLALSNPSCSSPRTNQRSSTRLKTQVSLAQAASFTTNSPKPRSRSSVTAGSSTSSDVLNIITPSPTLRPLSKPPSVRSSHTLVTRTPTPLSLDKGKGRAIDSPISTRSLDSSSSTLTASSSQSHRHANPTPIKGRKRPRVITESDEEIESASGTSHHVQDCIVSRRKVPRQTSPLSDSTHERKSLAAEWSKIAAESGAAPISFTNDIDEEALPDLPRKFQYLESRYELQVIFFRPRSSQPEILDSDESAGEPDEHWNYVFGCDCISCDNPKLCSCQTDRLPEGSGPLLRAYTAEFEAEVVECNKKCGCYHSSRCGNRVAQTPRDIPIDVFKTSNQRGWGVRSSSYVEQGKLLGLYTGQIMSREKAKSLNEARYIYDLEEDMDGHANQYSVDSRQFGNWTRFINHSCDPNLRVALFVHDLPADSGMSYVVFVAKRDIPAGTEFTLEYDPVGAANPSHKKKSKQKVGNKQKCLCGAKWCRGYVNIAR